MLSGRDEPALRAQARSLKDHLLANPELRPLDVGLSLTRRAQLGSRASVLGRDRESLLDALEALAEGRTHTNLIFGGASGGADDGIAFMFTGQGAQRARMGAELAGTLPVFAEAFEATLAELDGMLDRPLSEALLAPAGSPEARLLDETSFTQPALFALEVALYRQLESFGLTPDYLIGHSVGEIAAAHVAGMLSLHDACVFVVGRGRLMGALGAGGAMAAVQISEREALAALTGHERSVAIAAVNGPGSVVVSGEKSAVEALLASWRRQGRRLRRLAVSHAFHSPYVDGMLDELTELARGLSFSPPSIPIVSNLTGEPISAERLCEPGYWARQARSTVRFADGVQWLRRRGIRRFVELGPDGSLSAACGECVIAEQPVEASEPQGRARARRAPVVVPALRHDQAEPVALARALAALWADGAEVRWSGLFEHGDARRVQLPTYAFQRERHWLSGPAAKMDASSIGMVGSAHPLLGAAVVLADGGGWLFTGRLSADRHGWIDAHRVGGIVLLPGSAFLELAIHAGLRVGSARVDELTIEAPLSLGQSTTVQLQVVVGSEQSDGRRTVEIHARSEDADHERAPEEGWTRHASGTLGAAQQDGGASLRGEPEAELRSIARGAWPPPQAQPLDVEALYDSLDGAGLEYGVAFQGVTAAWRDGEHVLAEVAVGDGEREDCGLYGIHPALLDAALHAATLIGSAGPDESLRLPFCWRGASLHRHGVGRLRVLLKARNAEEIVLLAADEQGEPVVAVESLLLRTIGRDALRSDERRAGESPFELDWVAVAASALSGSSADGGQPPRYEVATSERWALVDERSQGAQADLDLRAARAAGIEVVAYEDVESLIAGSADAGRSPAAVLIDLRAESAEPLREAAKASIARALTLVQRLLGAHAVAEAKLVLITEGAVPAGPGDRVSRLADSGVWGLIRSAQGEHPGRLLLLDLDGEDASVELLPAAVTAALEGGEAQLAIRRGEVRAPRLVSCLGRDLDIPAEPHWRLSVGAGRTLEELTLEPSSDAARPLRDGEARVAMRASGLNFRDVLVALGVVPGRDASDLIGHEGAGIVLEAGANAGGLRAGDRVMGLFTGSFGPVAIADRRMLVHVPAGWTFTQAASVPLAFLTAYHGLVDLAGVEAGERVLVHAAAGGVGMAAVQIAAHLGAQVLATASPAKWAALRELGLAPERIASSRDSRFAETFQQLAAPHGIDVVLNSLTGELIDASLGLLASGGRFVEMGVTDLRDERELAREHPGVAYTSFDLLDAGADRLQEMLLELVRMFEAGALVPLPVSAWDIQRAPEAFRFMSQGRHVGKIVLTLPAGSAIDGTVLLTGGTGALGRLLAKHLVRVHGARDLLLLSRRGPEAEGSEDLLAELTELGARARIVACDAGDRGQLEGVVAAAASERPLSMVVHAAGVLDDALFETLSREQLERVLAAKLDAAVNLHELTDGMDLSEFVLFSSAAGVLGAPGQANYAAANSFLDALASHRRSRGLAGRSLAWGLWAQQSEMTANMGAVEDLRMQRAGVRALSSEAGLAQFDACLSSGAALVLPMSLDRAALAKQAESGTLPSLLRDFVRARSRRARGTTALVGRSRQLAALGEDGRREAVLEIVFEHVAAVLGHDSPNAIGIGSTFKDLGFDSLIGVELRNRLVQTTGLQLPATLIFDHPTPEALVDAILGKLSRGPAISPRSSRMRPADDPIAIVGIGCRYPGGVGSAGDLWRLVRDEAEAIGEFPVDREWDLEALRHPDPDQPGFSWALQGSFLGEIADFDAGFFAIAPSEALAMDPQQRLLLEVCWEAVEGAAIDPTTLRGTQTAVFAGISSSGYGERVDRSPAGGGGFRMIGNLASVASGRVAYALGLEGPAVSIDTACSSSLVATHLACQALRQGECSLALAGGVTVMSSPALFVDFSRYGGLARDGRCKAFADAADGTGWSEGAGMLLLERLSDARRRGHTVLSLIRGSAVNQDGASNGLTAPNGPSQQRVIEQALANAGLSGAEVDIVEGHGTGTRLGDPIEAQALLATYGRGRDGGRPLWLGSVKSNIGHSVAAAGVAGVIKVVMGMREGVMPRSLHVDAPSSQVDWSSGSVRLLCERRAWEVGPGGRRRAGVSSFGISGTNAHLILEEAAAEGVVGSGAPSGGGGGVVEGGSGVAGPLAWVVSGRGAGGLRGQAARLLGWLEGEGEGADAGVRDVAFSLACRSVFEDRAVVVGEGRQELVAGLRSLCEGESGGGVLRGGARLSLGGGQQDAGAVVFMFAGQGSQRLGMGAALREDSPVFREAFDEVVAHLDGLLERPLREVLFAAEGSSQARLLDRTQFTQPALFAFEVALSRQLQSLGIEPDFLIGHSVGELAAVHVGGALGLRDACELVAARGRLMGALEAGGGMAALRVSEQQARELLCGCEGSVSIAAVNGPGSVVISGEREAVLGVVERCGQRGWETKLLDVSHAFHSPLIEDALAGLVEVAGSLSFQPARMPVVSNLTGEPLGQRQLGDPGYWARHAREAVRFADGIGWLCEHGARRFLELGPDGALAASARECVEHAAGGRTCTVTALQRRGLSERESLLAAVGELWVAGTPVDWKDLLAGEQPTRVPLPPYAFQRRRYWLHAGRARDLSAAGLDTAEHPLLGAAVSLADAQSADGGALFTARVSLESHPWLADHVVTGVVLLPGSALLEMALHAGVRTGCRMVQELTLRAPLVLDERCAVQVQVSVSEPDPVGARHVEIHSRRQQTSDVEPRAWTLHATGTLAPGAEHRAGGFEEDAEAGVGAGALLAGAWPPPDLEAIELTGLYSELEQLGLSYGPAFQGLTAAWRTPTHLLAEATLQQADGDAAHAYNIHPALLDSALHAIALDAQRGAGEQAGPEIQLPFAWRDVELHQPAATTLRIALTRNPNQTVNLHLADRTGTPTATIGELGLRAASARELAAAAQRSAPLHGLEWLEVPGAHLGEVAGEDWQVFDWTDSGIADAGAGGIADLARVVRAELARALRDLQRWLASDASSAAPLAILTAGAVATGEADGAPSLVAAARAGLVRSAQAENPGRIVLVDVDDRERCWPSLPQAIAIALDAEEPQVAIRGGAMLVPRVRALKAEMRAPVPDELFDGPGTVLITGGTGALGATLARHLVAERGVRSLLLASRSGPRAAGAERLRAELAQIGAEVQVRACDVSDRAQLGELIDSIEQRRPLRAVVHAAGMLADGVLGSQSEDSLEVALAPKVDAALHLHELTRTLELSAFVLFSSLAGVLGGPGQGNYAAANACLDALALRRRAEGLPALSLAWGPWGGEHGMAAQLSEGDRLRMRELGVSELTAETAMRSFDEACACQHGLVLPVSFDQAAMRLRARRGALPAPLRGLVGAARAYPQAAADQLLARLAHASEQERSAIVLRHVRDELAVVLHHASAQDVPVDRAFLELGLDSLGAVELRSRLETATGLRLPATLAFDHPNAHALAEHLLARLLSRRGRRRRAVAAARTDEPIAIVGMACRLPGGISSPADLWRLLLRGGDAISRFPSDRGWDHAEIYDPDPAQAGRSYSLEGGFLRDAAEFDPAFFGIGEREALAMDPQQRLMLEASWEAVEDAGVDPLALRGTATGVFAGVMYQDYASTISSATAAGLEGYLGTGSAGSVLSGRVAYALGLEGPAVSVDTACSSSLVALHWASKALRDGECGLALAGGATVMWTPAPFIEFSRQRGIAADGRCKSFGDGADGVGWSEGVAVLLLERLSDALSNGREVLAVVRGSAVNQDGASNGLTAPNGPSQERVIEQALAGAGIDRGEVDVVEGHGTGTVLGDPIEAQALISVYGRGRPADRPLRLGSVKSNIGHAQAAAGVAGVIKVVLAMRHGLLPRTLHAEEPSSRVDWSGSGVELLASEVPWRADGHPRKAGVSSFGISGTNAHVIIEEPPSATAGSAPAALDVAGAATAPPDIPPTPWVLSASGPAALHAQASRLASHLEAGEEAGLADIGLALARRPSLPDRAVIVGADRDCMLSGLDALARGQSAPQLVAARAAGDRAAARTSAFLFTGQGSQRPGMGRELHGRFPVFAAAFDEACALLDRQLGVSLAEVVLGTSAGGHEIADAVAAAGEQRDRALRPLDRTELAQAGLFAFEVALQRLLESFGVRPSFLIGHSIGELVAAHVAGVFSLEDACTLVAARGRLMGRLPEGGAMLAVQATEREAIDSLAGLGDSACLAAVNGPGSVVLSGELEAIAELERVWAQRSRKTSRLRVSHAFHSAAVDPMLTSFEEVFAGLSPAAPSMPVVSNLTGAPMTAEQACSARYWARHVRETVRFGEGIRWLRGEGVGCFVELGPDAVLSVLCREALDAERAGTGAAPLESPAVSLQRAGHAEVDALLRGLASTFCAGAGVDWAATFEAARTPVKLPTYAFQRKRFWLKPQRGDGDLRSAGQSSADHPLLGASIELAGGRGGLFTGRISVEDWPWIADHAVLGTVVLPGTAFVDLALHAGERLGLPELAELTLEAPLTLEQDGAALLQLSIGERDEQGRSRLEIHSRRADPDAGDSVWRRHATGELAPAGAVAPAPGERRASGELAPAGAATAAGPATRRDEIAPENWPPAGAERVQIEDLHDRIAAGGLEYGASFRGLEAVWRRDREVFAEVRLPPQQQSEAAAHAIHPALLDTAFHALMDDRFATQERETGRVALPFSFAGVHLHEAGASALRVALTADERGRISLHATDPAGARVISIDSLQAREIDAEQLDRARVASTDALLVPRWRPLPAGGRSLQAGQTWAFIGSPRAALLQRLTELDGLTVEVYEDREALLAALDRGRRAPAIAICDRATAADAAGDAELPQAVRHALQELQPLVKLWLADERLVGSRLLVVTAGAVAVEQGQPDLLAAPLWGFVQSAQAESPAQLLLVDDDGRQSSWDALPGAVACGEGRLALRDGAVFAPRLERSTIRPVSESTGGAPAGERGRRRLPFDSERTVLITGGTGGLGALIARHLVERHHAGHLLLVSRRGAQSEGAERLGRKLRELGAEVEIRACDVSSREQLTRLLGSIGESHPLGAVVHMAAAFDNGMSGSLTAEQIDRVLAPKLDAAWNLHELTAAHDLTAFVLFSSIAGLFGGPGQANYAAANVFLDRLAEARRTDGLAATSIVWGLWEQAGAGAELGHAELRRVTATESIAALSPQRGLELFDLALQSTEPVLLGADLDLAALRVEARRGPVTPLLRSLVRGSWARAAEAHDGGRLAQRLMASEPEQREQMLLDAVRSEAADVLALAHAGSIGPQSAFKEMGFDSLAAVELRNRLATLTGLRLPATLLFDHPTPREVAAHLLVLLTSGERDVAAIVDQTLADFERTIAAAATDESMRGQVLARLHALQSSLDRRDGDGDGDLDSASDDEMFEILDAELEAK
ncbi:MAG: SDR family NAD(P)-dependent oxidoreductase [Solirubrobacteraceae bacterium]